MKLFDVNVLIYAIREELPFHQKSKQMLDEVVRTEEPFSVSEIVLAGFIRLVCHRKTFKTPTPLSTAVAFAGALRNLPHAVPTMPGPKHWNIFCDLLARHQIPGDECWDAYLAAIAIESECEWISFDQGFARFSRLKWVNALRS